MRVKKILMYFRKNTADNLTFNEELVELVNGDLEVVVKVVPGHALHEKGLQRQIAVGTLVNSQQRRALAVPRLNRGSTAGQPDVLFPHRFT